MRKLGGEVGAVAEPSIWGGDPLAERLFPPEPRQIQWGLGRTRRILAELGDPHRGAPVLHVGGTNGKGSVATVLAGVLGASGRRVGLYTSPHLVSLRERFQVDGRPVPEPLLVEAAEEIRPILDAHGPSQFESGTVLAFHLFRKLGVDAMVVEVGLGGRLDATNVVEPLVTVVTNVSLDHRRYLGDTLARVAVEKAGILKQGVPAVVGERRPGLRKVFQDAAAERSVPLELLDPGAYVAGSQVGRHGTTVELVTGTWGQRTLRSPMLGPHQVSNLALAVRALERLPEGLRPPWEAVERGAADARLVGRMQVVERDGSTWVLDVAHNPAGARSLAEALRRLEFPRPLTLLGGVLADKDWPRMLPPLLEAADRALLTQPPSAPAARRWDPDAAAARFSRARGVEALPDFDRAFGEATRRGGTVLVTGSCSIVGDVLQRLGLAGQVLGT